MLCIALLAKDSGSIDLKLTNGTIIYLPYNKFAVGSATEQYLLTISGFTGYTTYSDYTPDNRGAALNTVKFSTRDKDNDQWPGNCTNHISGGWWYNKCAHISPNNQYKQKNGAYLNSQWHSLSLTKMKMRPKNCT